MDSLIVSFPGLLRDNLPDLLGHLFYISILIGTVLLTRKHKYGWLFRVVGDIGWVVIGCIIGMYSIMIWSTVFCLNDLRGFLKWKWSEDEDVKLQSERSRVTKVRCSKDQGDVCPTGRGCSKPSDGKPRGGHHAKCRRIKVTSSVDRVQEHKVPAKPRRTRPSNAKRKEWADAARSLEAARERIRKFDSLSESPILPKSLNVKPSPTKRSHKRREDKASKGN